MTGAAADLAAVTTAVAAFFARIDNQVFQASAACPGLSSQPAYNFHSSGCKCCMGPSRRQLWNVTPTSLSCSWSHWSLLLLIGTSCELPCIALNNDLLPA